MVPMTFISWIYHFWARFWPYFNFVDFRAYFGPFSLVNRDRQKMADLLMKMASNQKMQENKPTLKFNFTIEKRWPVSIFELFGPQHLSHWALLLNRGRGTRRTLRDTHCCLDSWRYWPVYCRVRTQDGSGDLQQSGFKHLITELPPSQVTFTQIRRTLHS